MFFKRDWEEVKQDEQDLIIINKKDWEAQEQFRKNKDFGKPLQKEQPEVDLEEEMRKELQLHYNDDQDVYWWNYLKNSFRHFYELGVKAGKEI